MLWVGPSGVPSPSPSVQRDHVHEQLNQIHVKEEQIDTSLNKTAYCVISLENDEQQGARQHFGGFMNNMIILYSRDACPFPWQHV
jgi:stage III sporulation protein SpoIIIAA